jgi:hypothetical protein
MKIEMTQQQYDAMVNALITAKWALLSVSESLHEQNKKTMGDLRAEQSLEMQNALDGAGWAKVKILL